MKTHRINIQEIKHPSNQLTREPNHEQSHRTTYYQLQF
jgi:hypothetical protein